MLINAFDARPWFYRRDKRKISNMIGCAARIRHNGGCKRYSRRIQDCAQGIPSLLKLYDMPACRRLFVVDSIFAINRVCTKIVFCLCAQEIAGRGNLFGHSFFVNNNFNIFRVSIF